MTDFVLKPEQPIVTAFRDNRQQRTVVVATDYELVVQGGDDTFLFGKSYIGVSDVGFQVWLSTVFIFLHLFFSLFLTVCWKQKKRVGFRNVDTEQWKLTVKLIEYLAQIEYTKQLSATFKKWYQDVSQCFTERQVMGTKWTRYIIHKPRM